MTLSVKHTIIIPSTQGLNEKADTTKLLAVKLHLAEVISRDFGGCTLKEAEGYYVADNGELVIERVCELYTIGKADNLTVDEVVFYELAKYVKEELDQECVLYYNQPCEMQLI